MVIGFWLASVIAGCVTLSGFRGIGLALLSLGLVLVAVLAWVGSLRAAHRRETVDLRAAQALLQQGDNAGARRLAGDLAASARNLRLRNDALTTIAWASLGEGRPAGAKQAIDRIQPQHHVDLHCLAVVHDALGQPGLAIQALEIERRLSCDAAKFLIDLHARQDRFDRVVAAAVKHLDSLGVENCRKVVEAAFEAWELGLAATLATALFHRTGATEDAAALVRAQAHTRNFEEVDRVVDEVLAKFRRQGRLPEARTLLAKLRVDRSLPSGVCRELDNRLRLLESDSAPSM
jgi:hypothetical protein